MGNAETMTTPKDSGIGSIIATAAIRTVWGLIIFVSLATTLFCCLFPYNAFIICRNMGYTSKALEFISVCSRLEDSNSLKRAAYLSEGIDLSAIYLQDNISAKDDNGIINASKWAVSLCGDYLKLDDTPRLTQSRWIDNYNISNTVRSVHPEVYDYEVYCRKLFVLSNAFLGDTAAELNGISGFLSATNLNEIKLYAAEVNAYFQFESYRGASDLRSVNASKLAEISGKIAGYFSLVDGTDLESICAQRSLCILSNNLYSKGSYQIDELNDLWYNYNANLKIYTKN